MDFNEYQQAASKTAIYPDRGENLYYPVLGLCGETGEGAEKIKKVMRDDGGVVSEDKRQDLKKELGDILWYISALSDELHLRLDDIASTNIEKLYSRKERNQIHGSGDDRQEKQNV